MRGVAVASSTAGWRVTPGRRVRCALLLACLWAVSAGAQDDVRAALADCLKQVRALDEQDRPKITDTCVGLEKALQSSVYAPWLPAEWWNDQLSADGLSELDELITPPPEPSAAGPDVALLQPVLENLRQAEQDQRPKSWFARTLEWLRHRLMRSEEEPDWLKRWSGDEEGLRQFARGATYVLFALIIALAAVVVVNELRVAGVFGRLRSRVGRRAAGAPAFAAAGQVAALGDVEPLQRPSWLLDRVLAAVTAGRAQTHRALTHRELEHSVRFRHDAQASAFARLVRCAERVRYAAGLPEASELDGIVTEGAQLLASVAPENSARA
jgi:hypothetical protein